jgi:hypothetical protein
MGVSKQGRPRRRRRTGDQEVPLTILVSRGFQVRFDAWRRRHRYKTRRAAVLACLEAAMDGDPADTSPAAPELTARVLPVVEQIALDVGHVRYLVQDIVAELADGTEPERKQLKRIVRNLGDLYKHLLKVFA